MQVTRIPRTVVILGLASFFTDFSSEMIYPLLPLFLATVLGAGALELGFIEGLAEATASILKVVSGYWTDRTRRRKPLIVSGYAVSGFFRPMIGLAVVWPMVLVLRFLDRVGKGLRTSPRDALIADVTPEAQRGAAYGLHRSMDHAGAVVGPLAASGLLLIPGVGVREVFLLAVVPAVITMVVLVAGIREPAPRADESTGVRVAPLGDLASMGRDYRRLLVALFVFTLGNATDAFILVRLADVGVSASHIALLWSAHSLVKMASNTVGGRVTDRLGHARTLACGWLMFASMYVAFAVFDSVAGLVTVFLLYGLHFGLVEPSERALVAHLVPTNIRGRAFGFFHLTVGLGTLPASVGFGLLWRSFGAPVAFLTGAGMGLIAAALMLYWQMTRWKTSP